MFGIHSDSIWSLQATTSFGHVYSGGRDGTVFRTCLSTRTSTAVLQESGPVLDLAVETGLLEGSEVLGSVWVGTTSSSVNCWKVPAHQELRGAGPASGGGGAGGEWFPVVTCRIFATATMFAVLCQLDGHGEREGVEGGWGN